MKRFGRIRTKLAAMLTAKLSDMEGKFISVEPEDFWLQQGDYRKSTWDLARWGVDVENLCIFSWDRMTDCVRHGFTIATKETRSLLSHWEREVDAKEIT